MAQPTTPANPQTVLILGGSYSGISTAHYLLKHCLPYLPPSTHQILLASASPQAICRPACPRALTSDTQFPQQKLFVDIPSQFTQCPKASIRFIHSTATSLDHSARTVIIQLADGRTETINYHALIIATGASTPSPLLGLNSGDASSLHASWRTFRAAFPATKSIAIAGGGPAGVETAGELGAHLNGRTKANQAPRVRITLITSAAQILPQLRPNIAQQAEHHLARLGVTILKNTRVQTVSPPDAGTAGPNIATSATLTLSIDQTLHADLYIPATGTYPNTAFIPSVLLAPDGRIATNGATLRVDSAGVRVYAIGDAAASARPAIHLIFDAVPVLCANVKRNLLLASSSGSENGASGSAKATADRLFTEDKRETQLVPIGRRKGVGAAMGWRLPSWVVWAVKGRDYWLWTMGGVWSGRQWGKEK
ncbi:hypothetical protein MMC21_005630 [Puttea exsequens]|nr:hypothetical protein [Puttea exsequens]